MANEIKLKQEYASKDEIVKDLALFNEGRTEKMYYCSYWNSVRQKRFYVPCTYDFFRKWSQMVSAEAKERNRSSRCIVPSKQKGLYKRCMEDCSNCPYGKDHRDSNFVNLDLAMESESLRGFFMEQEQDDPLAGRMAEELAEAMKKEIKGLPVVEQQIIVFFSEGHSDSEIARELGMAKSSVQFIRTRAFKKLRENLQNFVL